MQPGEVLFAIEDLDEDLLSDFSEFCCGDEAYHRELDEFLRDEALDYRRKLMNKTYLCYAAYGEENTARPVGFFSLSAAHILRDEHLPAGLPGMGRRTYPHKQIPALLIGRFAVDKGHQQRGHASRMMSHIRNTALALTVGCRFLALHVESDNDQAIGFYEREGFFFAVDVPAEGSEKLMLYDLISSERR